MTRSEKLLTIDLTSADGGRIELHLAGEIDPHTAVELSDALARHAGTAEVTELVLDLAGVTFIDSSGLRLLIATDVDLSDRGARLVLRSPSEATRRILEMTDLLDRLNVE